MDEADTYLPRLEAARGILNAGFSRQGRVQRMEKDASGKHKVEDFPVFARNCRYRLSHPLTPHERSCIFD